MTAWLLTSRLGHLSLALLCILLAGGLCYWRGHSRGWDSATAHYSAVVNSCLAANSAQERTIAQLQAANQQWADTAKGNAEKLSQAAEQVELAKAANAKALAEAQRKLRQVIHATHTSSVWGATRVPAAVLCQLQHDANCQDQDGHSAGADRAGDSG